MEVTDSTQRHTRQTEADRAGAIYFVLFTLCDGSFVFCDMTSESSAQVMVRRQITRVESAQLLELAYLWDTPLL